MSFSEWSKDPMKHSTDYKWILVIMGLVLAFGGFLSRQYSDHSDFVDEMERELELRDAELESLRSQIRAMESQNRSGGAEVAPEPVSPSEGYVFPVHKDDFLFYTSPYGLRVSPLLGIEMKHTGVDIATVWRAQVVSMADGVVVEHWPPPGEPYPGGGSYRGHPVLGGKVVIDHGDGIQTVYGHMDWTRVAEGMRVSAGEIIGRVGRTGRATGMHLHFEVIINEEPVNPLLYVEAR